MEFTDVELILIMGALIAAIILLVALLMLSYRVMLLRAGGGSDTGPAHAAEYDTLQVVIEAHGQEAELEVATEGFDTYEEVSAPPCTQHGKYCSRLDLVCINANALTASVVPAASRAYRRRVAPYVPRH